MQMYFAICWFSISAAARRVCRPSYDIRASKALGRKKELSLTLDPFEPALLAFSASALPALHMTAPQRVARGEIAAIALRVAEATPAATHAIHIDVTDPDCKPALDYSGNLLARGGAAERLRPFAQSDKTGKRVIAHTTRSAAERRRPPLKYIEGLDLEEYLNTSYRPDMDYVDGVLVSRNVGTQLHGLLQGVVATRLWSFRHSHRLGAFIAVRLLVSAATGRYRVPDVMAVAVPYQKGKFIVDVPAIVVEILSPEDTFDDIVDRCLDYEALTVPNILVMDPEKKRAWKFVSGGLQLLTSAAIDLSLPNGLVLNFPIAEIFAELDED